jgi:TolA-binding protein
MVSNGAEPPALWRQAFDAAEKFVAPRLESVVRTDQFAQATALGLRAQAALTRQANGVAAKVWHLVNLPAGTDVLRLRAQVGALDREVRRLTLALEQQQLQHQQQQLQHQQEQQLHESHNSRQADERTEDAAADKPGGGARSHPPRGRAKRPAGS